MKSLIIVTCLVAVCFVATNAANVDTRALLNLLEALEKRRGGGGGGGRGRGGPPPHEIACDGKVATDACSFEGRDGADITGECKAPPVLVCKPTQQTRSLLNDLNEMEKRHGPGGPPKCDASLAENAACSFVNKNGDTVAGTCVVPLLCAPSCTTETASTDCLPPHLPPGSTGTCEDDGFCGRPNIFCDANYPCKGDNVCDGGFCAPPAPATRSLIDELKEMVKKWE